MNQPPLRLLLIFTTIISLTFGLTWCLSNDKHGENQTAVTKPSKAQRIADAIKDNFERTKDPKLGYPPVERLAKAIEQTRQMQQRFALQKNNKFASARFKERGPNNIGGRTRSILIDLNDPTRKTIFAGGVTGGLWKTNNIAGVIPKWQKINDYLDNLSIGSLAQDPNNPQIMYMGTGEGYGEIAAGVGIFRSLDGGTNWTLLPATNNGQFIYTRDLLVHPSGDVYAGTSAGLFRSQDQGNTWERVLGVAAGALVSNVYEINYAPANNTIYVALTNVIFTSQTGNRGEWVSITPSSSGFPNNWSRAEISVSLSNPNIIYAIGSIGGAASSVYKTLNGGTTWQNVGKVGGVDDFTNGQAWYDLEIAVDPFNPQHIIAGGVPIFRSLNGGISWERFANNMHVDQHVTVFDEEQSGIVYFGNDGGVWRSTNGSATTVQNRNLDYNVTQFYAGAIHPEAFSNYILGGTQDNNSLQLNGSGITSAAIVNGGDGMLCHIDQNEPQYQLVSSQFGNYVLSIDGGKTFGGGASVNGAFVNPSDYDDLANILYTETSDGDYYRWKIPTGTPELVNIQNADPAISVVYVDPSTPNRVYFGTFGGDLFQVDNAHAGNDKTAKRIRIGGRGEVSGVVVEKNDPNHLLITYSNYGLSDNVLETKDGGTTWINVEGNLPDVPVRSVLFSPENNTQAVIATEIGVWFTEKLDGSNTVWIPPAIGKGTPLVRTDMLQLRESDGIILAATHGRGMFTSDVFAQAKVALDAPQIGYLNAPVQFLGSVSLGGESYNWTFGDGEESSQEDPKHQYQQIGTYEVTLTLNDSLTTRSKIKILPDKLLPYAKGKAEYSGDFDRNPQDYGVHTISGSAFDLGKSSINGKNGTFSGNNAFVLGINEQFYQKSTHTMLYLPNFDFSESGIYEFSFWSKYFVQNGFDGFLVEYSTNKGQSWDVLGVEQPNWYDFTNTNNLEGASFSDGIPYFARSRSEFTQFYLDVSFLSGNKDVAFRFVFKSNDVGNHPGVVIDDVEIKKYEGDLATRIVSLSAGYTGSEEITVEWVTEPEYYATRFVVERSLNGRDYDEVAKVEAKGRLTNRVQSYTQPTLGIRNLYFYRIRSLNENKSTSYVYEFTTPPVVVRRELNDVEIYSTFPNPFSNYLDITFTDFVNEPIRFELFDMAGRLLLKREQDVKNVYLRIETGALPQGTYLLNYKIGTRAAKTIKLLRM